MNNTLIVCGLFGLLAAGLLAFIIVSWLKYQKEAAGMEIREAQLLQQSEMNILATEQAREKIAAVMEGASELEKDVPKLRERLALLRGSKKKDEDKDFHSATRHKVE